MEAGNNKLSTYRLVYTSLTICLVLLGTVLFRIPIPMTQGYVHLGDAMIYIGILLLGRRSAAAAAGLGSALADILGGYAFWAPWSLVIKFAMAYICGLLIDRTHQAHTQTEGHSGRKETALLVLSMTAGGAVMCAGYFIAESVMYSSMALAAISVPWNIAQFMTGIVIALAARPLCRHISLS